MGNVGKLLKRGISGDRSTYEFWKGKGLESVLEMVPLKAKPPSQEKSAPSFENPPKRQESRRRTKKRRR